jgi:hypothetical protein
VGLYPAGHNWQFHMKLTFELEASRVTNHSAQTEVKIIFLSKGWNHIERCHKALCICIIPVSLAVWTCKDSKENIVRNITKVVEDAAEMHKQSITSSCNSESISDW